MPYLSLSLILQILAIIHWAKRRPDTYWLWIIIIGGPLGSLAYMVMEVLPDVHVKLVFQGMHRRKRIKELETIVLDNPAAGNYEELAELYNEEKKFERARECFDKAISSRTDMPNPFYGRALCSLHLDDFKTAVADLERVAAFDRKYDYQRAYGLLAYAYARTGEREKAEKIFRQVIDTSTLSETQYNYATFLAEQGRAMEARQLAIRILNKKATLPRYLKRRERPWFRRAEELLKQFPAVAEGSSSQSASSSP